MASTAASPPLSLFAQSASGAQQSAKPRDKRFIVRLRRRPASAPGALTHELIPTPTAPLATAAPSPCGPPSHPLSSSLSSDNDSQRSQFSDSCGSVLGKRPSLGDELSAPLRKRSCLRVCAPGSHLKLDANGTPLRIRFCEDLVAVRTLAPDHKREASRLSWYSEPGWDPLSASREVEGDSSDESDVPEATADADHELSQTEADMLAADLEYEVRREAAAAAHAAKRAARGGVSGWSESDDDEDDDGGDTSSSLASITDDDSSSDDAEMQVAGGGVESPLFSTLFAPAPQSLPPMRCAEQQRQQQLAPHGVAAVACEGACGTVTLHAAVDVAGAAKAACLEPTDMMTTEAFVEWATCTMDGATGGGSPPDEHVDLPLPLSECCSDAQPAMVTASRPDLPPCSFP